MQIQLTKQEVIGEMTRRLVEFYRPVRIYLFGSEARGEAGPDSDLDFLVEFLVTSAYLLSFHQRLMSRSS